MAEAGSGLISRVPPVVWLAVAFTAGTGVAAFAPIPARSPAGLILLLLAALPILASRRPRRMGASCGSRPAAGRAAAATVAAVAAGMLSALATEGAASVDRCDGVPGGSRVAVDGYLITRPPPGLRSSELRLLGKAHACAREVTVVLPRNGGDAAPGHPFRIHGEMSSESASRAGPRYRLYADSISPSVVSSGLRGRWVARRAAVQQRLHGLFPRRGDLVDALVLARKERLDPELRDDFAVTGLAHLLAISGFHVGVVAGLTFAILRTAGLGRAGAGGASAAIVWMYVIAIGVPDAAARAATLLTCAAIARARRRPPHRTGALAAAWLVMLVADVRALARIGFQLSFAGALGLVVLAPRIDRGLARTAGAVPSGLRSAVAAGASATLFTLPLVAWHFERVSLVGIPATLLVAPLVSLCIPGIAAALVASALHPGVGSFLAGGVEWLLEAVVAVVQILAAFPFASAVVPRTWVPAGAAGMVIAGATAARGLRARGSGRRAILLAGAASGLLAWPIVAGSVGRGALELVVLDVGQGDAIAIRSPAGRWILVDAGPRNRRFDAGARVVVPYLRRRGVRRLEALILTHADLDHVGGAPAVFAGLDVARVFDPGLPEGRSAYVSALEAAEREGAPWQSLTAGRILELDGATVRVAHPTHPPPAAGNDASVVLEVRFGGFAALLTGDAEAASEASMLLRSAVRPVQVLKVGHHGSSTSTGAGFLERADPEVALIPVGRRNRYGHPDPDVLARLIAHGARVFRTDRHGTIRVTAWADGRYRVEPER